MSESLAQVRSQLAKWLDRRFELAPGSIVSEQILEQAMDQLVAKFGHNLQDREPILKLGYTIVERRAIDWFRSTRSGTRRIEADVVDDRDPSQEIADQEVAWKAIMAGCDAANDEQERELWLKWTDAIRHGERVTLDELSRRIWPDKHRGHASRTLARLLSLVERKLRDDA